MIYNEVLEGEFVDAVRKSFSVEQARALYDYLYDLSEDIGEPMKLDPVAIRCDFAGYNSIFEVSEDYKHEEEVQCILQDAEMDEDEKKDALLDWFRDQTLLIGTGTEEVVIQVF